MMMQWNGWLGGGRLLFVLFVYFWYVGVIISIPKL